MKGTPLGQGFRTQGRALAGVTVVAGALTLGAAGRADAANLTVSNTHSSGKGSFAAAIKRASKKDDLDKIGFARKLDGRIDVKNLKIPSAVKITGNGTSGRHVILTGPSDGAGLEFTRGIKHDLRRLDLERLGVYANFPSKLNGQLSVVSSVLSGDGIDRVGALINGNDRYENGDLTVSKTTIEGFAEGVAAVGANARVGRSIIRDNQPDGGVESASYSHIDVVNSTISGNQFDTTQTQLVPGGGGVRGGYYAGVVVTNSTVVGNSAVGPGAYGGGGAYNVSFDQSTITGNSAPTGGGVGRGQHSSHISLSNSILAGNTATDPGGFADCGVPFSFESKGGNVIGDPGNCATRGDDLAGVDPILGALQNNGGPTPTIAIGEGSPAIGLAIVKEATERDQRGVKRGKDPDAGAFEFSSG